MPWWLIIVAVALVAASYLLRPKIPKTKPDSVTELDEPVAAANKPVAVPFGTITIKEANELWYGDKQERTGTA